MSRRLVLLTGTFEAQLLGRIFANEGVPLTHIQSMEQWADNVGDDLAETRLLAFCTSVIVPAGLLRRLPGPSYNVHPGPPCYPGRHPESWGAYHGTPRFGATLHEMAPRVDEGRIVDVKWVDVPAGGGQLEYGMKSFRASLDLVAAWRTQLAAVERPLPCRADVAWSGHKTSHAELDAMCHVTPDMTRDELERRQKSFAQVPGSRMTLRLHGRTFVYTVPEPAAAVMPDADSPETPVRSAPD